jgi:hypothetical protein
MNVISNNFGKVEGDETNTRGTEGTQIVLGTTVVLKLTLYSMVLIMIAADIRKRT